MFPGDLFQSLIGIYGFSGFVAELLDKEAILFQSLIGIYGFSGVVNSTCYGIEAFVSIPNRDLWVFRRFGRLVAAGLCCFNP